MDSLDNPDDYITKQYRLIKLYEKVFLIDKELYDNIQSLPRDIKHRLYIRTMREYWKDQGISMISRVPSWRSSAIKQEILLFEARHKNIHFLHLPCNTLPEYKTYIVGCQCDYCKYKVNPLEKLRKIRQNTEDIFYFMNNVPQTDSIWNDKIEEIGEDKDGIPMYGLPVFNPDYEIN